VDLRLARPHDTRVALTDYVGAGSRIDRDRGLELDADRWAYQPKHDGAYARVSLDRRGRIANVLARSGLPLRDAADLIGVLAGPPDSVLHGELEAHTEAGNRIAQTRGWRALHLFDVTRHAGRDCSWLAYGDRYDLMRRDRDQLEQAGVTNPWIVDDQGDAHDTRTGRYVKATPRNWTRLPIVPLVRNGAALWREHVELGGGEGLVAVRLDAPARKRGAKRKIKQSDTIDATVVAVDARAAMLSYRGHMFAVSSRAGLCSVGDVVEVKHDGWYERSVIPRFARITRVRRDLH
jgi:hypothetical protein